MATAEEGKNSRFAGVRNPLDAITSVNPSSEVGWDDRPELMLSRVDFSKKGFQRGNPTLCLATHPPVLGWSKAQGYRSKLSFR